MKKIFAALCTLMIVPTLALANSDMVSISELRQQDSGQTDDRAGHNDPPTDLFLHCGTPLVIFLEE